MKRIIDIKKAGEVRMTTLVFLCIFTIVDNGHKVKIKLLAFHVFHQFPSGVQYNGRTNIGFGDTEFHKDMIQEKHMRWIAECIPGAEFKILDGEKHGSYIIHSKRIAEVILEICEKEY